MCCIICTELEKGNLTKNEALKNLGELITTEDEDSEEMRHYFEVIDKIAEPYILNSDDAPDMIYFDDLDEEDDECL